MPLLAGATAVYNSGGLSYYRHPDWLGSSRFASTPGRAMYSDTAYAPFGETYAQAGTADPSFTGQNQDTVGGLYDFMFREYSTQGRWPSPDPAGLGAVDPGNPQSWNRYAYVLNDPLMLIDPLGLDGCQSLTCVVEDDTDARSTLQIICQNSPGLCPLGQLGRGTPLGMEVDLEALRETLREAIKERLRRLQEKLQRLATPVSATVIVPLVPFGGPFADLGPAFTIAFIPKTLTVCAGAGLGVQAPTGGRTVAGGPFLFGDVQSAREILNGPSLSIGLQPNPGRGVQVTGNFRGNLGGPTAGYPPGTSVAATISGCIDFRRQ